MAIVAGSAGCSAGPRPNVSSGTPTPAGPVVLPTVGGLPPTITPEAPGRDDHGPLPPAPPVAQARMVAAQFATAWTRSGEEWTPERWLAGIRPWCEPRFAAALSTVDPATVPARAVTGAPIPVREPVAGPAVYTVTTDAGVLHVTVAAVDGRWLAADVDFTRAVS